MRLLLRGSGPWGAIPVPKGAPEADQEPTEGGAGEKTGFYVGVFVVVAAAVADASASAFVAVVDFFMLLLLL